MLNDSALITGGGRGIGRAIALALRTARRAHRRRRADSPNKSNNVATRSVTNAIALVCDVADPESVTRMFEREHRQRRYSRQ